MQPVLIATSVAIGYQITELADYTCVFVVVGSGELRTQKLKSNLLRTQSLKVLPLQSGVGQYIAIHATLTARHFFLADTTLPVHSLALSQNLSRIFLVLAVANTGSCVGPQNKIGHPAGCRFPC